MEQNDDIFLESSLLQEGEILTLVDGSQVQVLRAKENQLELGGGGQGDVYKVFLLKEKKEMALKVYNHAFCSLPNNVEFFHKVLVPRCLNHTLKAPEEVILPEKILDDGKHIGHLMRLIPASYINLGEQIAREGNFAKPKEGASGDSAPFAKPFLPLLKVAFNTALLLDSFKGFCFQDLNEGSFYLDPLTSKVLICDAENIIVNGHREDAIVEGNNDYLAPELIKNPAKGPDKNSDRYSFSVLLFTLLMGCHPLHGQGYYNWRGKAPKVGEKPELNPFVKNPVYILDPSERNQNLVQSSSAVFYESYGKLYPKSLLALFERAFTIALVDNYGKPRTYNGPVDLASSHRVSYGEWEKELAKDIDLLMRCPYQACHKEFFFEEKELKDDHKERCPHPNCKREFFAPLFFKSKNAKITIIVDEGKKLYRHHLYGSEDFSSHSFDEEGEFFSLGEGKWAFHNESGKDVWVTLGERKTTLRDGGTTALSLGMKLFFPTKEEEEEVRGISFEVA
jgi:serine/threonine protein kinase